MKTIITIMIALLINAAGYSQKTDSMLKSYLQLKDALVKSDSKAESKYTVSFQKEIEAAETFAEKESLLKAVQKMVKATVIEKQRSAFAEVSPIFWKALKKEKVSQDVYYQYCPMKKSYWISNEAAIKNPYYGSSMLNCGNVSDKIIK